jgi:hypothetical protein
MSTTQTDDARLAKAAQAILAERGISPGRETAEEYVDAVELAEARAGVLYGGAAPRDLDAPIVLRGDYMPNGWRHGAVREDAGGLSVRGDGFPVDPDSVRESRRITAALAPFGLTMETASQEQILAAASGETIIEPRLAEVRRRAREILDRAGVRFPSMEQWSAALFQARIEVTDEHAAGDVPLSPAVPS